LSRKDTFTLI